MPELFRKRFFTLAEVLIGVAISMLVSGTILAIYIFSFRASISGFEQIGVLQDIRNHTHKIVHDLKYCRKVIELKQDLITVKTVSREGDTSDLITVTYRVDKQGNNNYVIKRIAENKDDEILYRFNKLNTDVFSGYIASREDMSFFRYEPSLGGRDRRQRLVMIKINIFGMMQEYKKQTPINMVTRVSLDYLKEKIDQKFWNYRQ